MDQPAHGPADLVGRLLADVHRAQADVEEGVAQVLAQEGHVAPPAHVQEIQVRQLGERLGVAVRVLAAIVDAERPVLPAPLHVEGHEVLLPVVGGDHHVGAFAVQEDGFGDVPHVAVPGDRGGPGRVADHLRKAIHHLGDLAQEAVHLVGPVVHVQEDRGPAQVQGHVDHAAPVDVAQQAAVPLAQGVEELFGPLEGRALEGRVRGDFQPVEIQRLHLGRAVRQIVHPAPQHLRDQVAGREVYGPDDGEALAVGLPKPVLPPSLVEDVFHLPLDFDPPGRMIEAVLVEGDPRVVIPPGGPQHDVHREHLVLQRRIAMVWHDPSLLGPHPVKPETLIIGFAPPRATPGMCHVTAPGRGRRCHTRRLIESGPRRG